MRIDKLSWGKIVVNGEAFHQVIIVGDQVLARNIDKLNQLFETTHRIGDWEVELLLKDKPEIILIADGWSGVLKVTPEVLKELGKSGTEIKILHTQKAVKEFNRLAKEGKRVNALFHTTC